jgi:hypothetical protein
MSDNNSNGVQLGSPSDDLHFEVAADPKPGHKTTEFWIHLAAVILGALATIAGLVESYAHGTVTSTAALMAAIGVVSSTLSSLGYTASRTIVKTSAIFLLAIALSLMSGCSAEQLAREEAVAHAALSKLEKGIDWATANPDTVNALLEDASKVSGDPALQKAIDKARSAVAAGDLQAAKKFASLGVAMTAPVASGQ